jgi:broad specificity phosphatase PhoE
MGYIFVRHGITENLEGGRIQGWSPTPLSARGRQQAQAAAGRLAIEGGVTRIYSSPVRRTMETAGIIGSTLGLPVEQFAALAERRMPSRFWGMARTDIVEYLAAFEAHSHEPDWAYEDEDSLRACIERARDVVAFLHEQATEPGKMVLVTHGTILRLIIATLLLTDETPLSAWADVHNAMLGPQPCAFAEVAPGPARMAVRGWNDITHLKGLLDYDQGPGA